MSLTAGLPRTDDYAAYIRDHATQEELDILQALCNKRREIVWAVRGSLVRTGRTVELINMKPKYLNGLVGTVTRTHKGRKGGTLADIALDAPSATRHARARRAGRGPADVIEGVPLAGLTVHS
ncbi:hypothetical protein [Streptomyces yaizuensis]|uniref:Uncharacterized protein n=1 Tax=Streptomyces yaizuensis TaxID=2989713 RepID=A0ABQ5P6Q7_9ACTN|nr:hypothetical protein [Streptomyces sp. YSPA8]GLF98262.1 hypothetical protein SYYSPA8_28215 [Streptomyces sp. YSPA8]